MPLWKVYHPVGAYTDEDKHELSKRITDVYFMLPRFYVGVIFYEVPEASFYIGGQPTRNFVRIHADHVARQMDSEAKKTMFLTRVEGAIAPFIKDRGFALCGICFAQRCVAKLFGFVAPATVSRSLRAFQSDPVRPVELRLSADGLKFLHVLAPHQLTIDDLVKDIEDPYYAPHHALS